MKIMFRYPQLLLLTAVLLLPVACTQKDDYVQKSIQEATGDIPSVFSIDKYEFDPQGGAEQFSYVSDGRWSVEKCPDWVVVSPTNGQEGRTIINISASLNTDWKDRSDTLAFRGNDGARHAIAMKQDCPKLGLSVRPMVSDLSTNVISVSVKGSPDGVFGLPFLWSHANNRTEPVELTITSNVHWRLTLGEGVSFGVSDDKDTQQKTLLGHGDKVLYLNTLSNNYSKEDVEDLLTLKAYTNDTFENEISKEAIANWTIDLSQSHLKFLIGKEAGDLRADDQSVTFDELGYVEGTSSFEQSIFVDCELPWRAVSTGFVKLDDSSNGQANTVVSKKISIQHPATNSHVNDKLETQEDAVLFEALDQNGNPVAQRSLSVAQLPYVFSLDQTEMSVENGVFLEDGTRSFTLEEGQSAKAYSITFHTTGMWMVEDLTAAEQDWLVVDPETRSGGISRTNDTRTVRFWVKKQNLSLSDILASIRIRANYSWVTENNVEALQKAFCLTQKRFQFAGSLADASPLSATQLFADGFYRLLNISSSGPWRLCIKEGDVFKPVSESSGTWVNVSSDNGNALATDNTDSQITFGATSPNPYDNADRQTTLYLQSLLHEQLPESQRADYAPVEIPIVQRRFTFKVNSVEGDSNYPVVAYKPSFDDVLPIESDGNWEITEWPSWLNPSPTSAYLSDGDVNKSVALNPSVYSNLSEARNGVMKIKCTFPGRNNLEYTIRVEQSPLTFGVSSSSETDFAPACNFPYNGAFFGDAAWNFNVSASLGLPWVMVTESGSTMNLSYDRSSNTNGTGPLTGGHLYPSYNSTADSRLLRFHFETNDSRFETPVKTESFQFTQSGYQWSENSINNMTFDALGNTVSGNTTINFICSGPWVLENNPSWMNISGISYTSDPNFTVRVNANTQMMNSGREQTVTIRSLIASNVYFKTFTITQWPYFFDNSTPSQAQFPTLDATDRTVTFQCSGGWEVTDASGIILSASSGSGKADGGELTLRFRPEDYYNDTQDRTGSIRIRSTDNSSFVKEIPYSQPKYVFSLDVNSIRPDGPKDAAERTVNVNLTNGDQWQATSDNSEILNLRSASGSGNGAFRVTPVANYTQSERTATITVSSTRGNKTKEISFVQPAYRFSTESSVTFTAAAADKQITVTSDGNWTLTKDGTASWLTIGTTSGGAGQVTVKLSAAKNETGNGRSVTLTLKGSDHSSLERKITVSQDK